MVLPCLFVLSFGAFLGKRTPGLSSLTSATLLVEANKRKWDFQPWPQQQHFQKRAKSTRLKLPKLFFKWILIWTFFPWTFWSSNTSLDSLYLFLLKYSCVFFFPLFRFFPRNTSCWQKNPKNSWGFTQGFLPALVGTYFAPWGDTYDPCTAPVLPPPVDANKQLRRQVRWSRGLEGRVGWMDLLVGVGFCWVGTVGWQQKWPRFFVYKAPCQSGPPKNQAYVV